MTTTLTTMEEQPQPKPIKRRRDRFPRQDIERALIALAYHNGSAHGAAKALKEQGLSITKDTIRRWAFDKYPTLYREVQEQVLPEIRAKAAQMHMEAAERTMEVEKEVLAHLKEKHHEIPARDLPGAVRNLGVTTGVHRDKARDLRGETTLPTSEVRDLKGIIRSLSSKGLDVEEVDAEVVEEKPKAELESST